MEDKKEGVYSKVVRAGKRTYFFDVKTTKSDDYYLTITESKKRFNDDGTFTFQKHKIFLYREDFDKFNEGLKDVFDFINREKPYTPQPETEASSTTTENNSGENSSFSNVEFEDLK
ncbi:MAG: hypothetical protein POELPBGB_00759 [Bacteroidia bacterium]|nr:hypothetical protein [Bacteroidia bacterium]